MQRDPVKAQYADAVQSLLIETLDLGEKECTVQAKVWIQFVEMHNSNPQHWADLLRTSVHDGYLARWISILLAPREDLRPYVWPTNVTIPDTNAEILLAILEKRRNAAKLKEFVARLQVLNTSYNMTCV